MTLAIDYYYSKANKNIDYYYECYITNMIQ